MTETEKALYLFNQTCILLSKGDSPSAIRERAGIFSPPRDFDSTYAWLESKLDEKLNAIQKAQ
ncbi:hypothetical protein [Yersinia sp. 2105 StPb PI]|uniref:hypothetical protein n=1 Tax=Yersinia sp. 2105 StPb PI TaxID=2507058 RepID=UPI000FFB6822|nr:hypothetical protein [Yersinia sp. 2105 StPb PI]RXA95606.1 hypothetical protein EQP49_13215 [Yersinia sp. 2105 StPb PI]